jgi:WXG100 family type VII secretion target
MTHFAVDLELLDDLIDRLVLFSSHLDGVRDDVDRRMQRVHAVWAGQAATEAVAAHELWAGNAAEMQQTLATLRSISSTARGNYAAAVEANARMWSG